MIKQGCHEMGENVVVHDLALGLVLVQKLREKLQSNDQSFSINFVDLCAPKKSHQGL